MEIHYLKKKIGEVKFSGTLYLISDTEISDKNVGHLAETEQKLVYAYKAWIWLKQHLWL